MEVFIFLMWLERISQNHPTTVHLDFTNALLGDGGGKMLAKALEDNTVTQTLNLDGCRIEDEALARITKALEKHPCITTLDLTENFFTKKARTALLEKWPRQRESAGMKPVNVIVMDQYVTPKGYMYFVEPRKSDWVEEIAQSGPRKRQRPDFRFLTEEEMFEANQPRPRRQCVR